MQTKKKTKSTECVAIQFSDETKVHPALKEHLGYCLFKVTARWKANLLQAILHHGVIGAHMALLKVLDKSPEPLNQNRLSEEMGIDKASMVKLIDHLENKEYLVRETDPSDRRNKKITITTAGRRALTRIAEDAKKAEREFLKKLSESEQKSFKEYVLRLLGN